MAERAQQTARRKAIYLELHPETEHGGNRTEPSRQIGDLPPAERFTANTAKATGQSGFSLRGHQLAKAALATEPNFRHVDFGLLVLGDASGSAHGFRRVADGLHLIDGPRLCNGPTCSFVPSESRRTELLLLSARAPQYAFLLKATANIVANINAEAM